MTRVRERAVAHESTDQGSPPRHGWLLQRSCACGGSASSLDGECDECRAKRLQRSALRINAPGDQFEREAEQAADAVAAGHMVRGQLSSVGRYAVRSRDEDGRGHEVTAPPTAVSEVLASTGVPLDAATRAYMEPRFGHDFGAVRVHAGAHAANSAQSVHAAAYTFGRHVVFGAGRLSPSTPQGRRLLAHELAHVVQQEETCGAPTVVQRETSSDDMDMAAEREYGDHPAPNAKKCGRPSDCPEGFCDPYRSEDLAKYYRSKNAWWIMGGIAAVVDSKVMPLWKEYLWGGSSKKNLSAEFGKDFTNSPTTLKSTQFLYGEIASRIGAKAPATAPMASVSLDLATLIPDAIASLGDATSMRQMNFSLPRDIPGNIAGGIGKDQAACPAGAIPSTMNDDRTAAGTVGVLNLGANVLLVTPSITYTVKDTIDLCPGDCGTLLEKTATVPLSQFEATGISGDVPFQVDFPAPTLPPLIVTASSTPSPTTGSTTPPGPGPAGAPVAPGTAGTVSPAKNTKKP